MRHPITRVSRSPRRAAALLCLALLLPLPARAAEPGQALVIGEGSYTGLPRLPACALSAHSVAASLRRLGFAVEEQEDATSGAMFAGIATLTRRIKAAPDAPVFVYVCGYA
ncbi:MAG TPA: caspase family protein, partial [Acetobacteraceae bacterium]|nr:caspase family protein [Acetobacteraceae bacterium]